MSGQMTNRRILLARYPEGLPREDDFALENCETPAPEDGQVLVRTKFISVDPYIRGRLRNAPGRQSYIAPIAQGMPMESGCAGEVVSSRHASFQPGDSVQGRWAWQESVALPGKALRKLDKSESMSASLGVLGLTGLTAYFGLLEIGKPKAGESVVVSGAAGATGATAGQIAKIQGCRVIGIAGTGEKVAYLKELGFDGAFNYRTETAYKERLRELCPNGVDVYFDNTGGPVTDAVFPRLNSFARVVLCGQISEYNRTEEQSGPRLLFHLVIKQARAEGFLVNQFAERFGEARGQLAAWLREGRLKHRETIVDGFENTPRAFIAMLRGENIGKQLVRL